MYNHKISRVFILFITVIAIGFSSCHTYKDLPDSPQVDAQGILRTDSMMNADTSRVSQADTAMVDTTSIASIPWKEYFTDPKLQVLINEGLSNNVDMQVAMTRISQAEASLSMARGALLP
ncbi:MAG TPA: hypothetical protein VHO90_03025, partial [Bacteroidales bacterium]|nr:hypothetical protein [Bacteroidales bacterium]